MAKTKKILSVVLAFSLIFSIFLIDASAALGSGKTMGVVLTTDKTEISKGDTVTVTLHIEFSDYSTLIGGLRLALLYDSSVYTPDVNSAKFLNDFEAYYNTTKKPAVNANFLTAVLGDSTLSAEEKATCTGALMNQFQVLSSMNGGITEAMGYNLTQDASADYSVPEWEVTFKVTGDPAAGSTKIFVCDGMSTKSQYLKTTDGTKVVSLTSSQVDFTNAVVAPSAAAAGPVLTAAGRQIKMTLNEAGTDAVAGTEQLRVVSSFSAQDWNDYFVNTGKKDANEQPIKVKALKEVGIVASKGAFDLETAKGYAMQGKGEYGDYKVATTDYIQQTAEGLYRFGARIEYQTGVYDTTYIAFATYWDENSVEHTIFYDAQADIAYNTNHSGIVNAYILGLKK